MFHRSDAQRLRRRERRGAEGLANDLGRAAPSTAAVGTSGPAGGGSRLLGACDLVTQAEAKEALGQDVKAGQFDLASLGDVGCRYEAVRDTEFASVTVHLTPTHTFLSAENSVADPARKGQEVSGVGEKAFAWGNGRTIDLYVKKGSEHFRVHVGDLSGTKIEAQKTLATKVAGRLEGRGQAYGVVFGAYSTEKQRLPEFARNPKGVDPCTLLAESDAQAAGAIAAGVRATSVARGR